MQSTQTPQGTPATQPTAPAQESGFQPIPTRMKDLAPLVVDPPNETQTLVVEQLEALETQLANVHAIAAEAYTSQGEYERAQRHIDVSVSFAREDPRYQNQSGYLHYLNGNDDEAIAAFTAVVEQLPNQVDALCNLGMVHFGREEYDTAREWFGRAVQISSQDPEIWNNLGASIFQSGKPEEAANYFRKALEIDPGNEDAKANLASC